MSKLTKSARTILRRLPMTLFVAASAWYIVGGAQGFSHLGTRIRQWFAPTQQELQVQAAQAPPPPVANVPIRTREFQQAMLTEPLPLADQVVIVSAIIVIAIGFMYFTGRGSSA
jgi:hypothetical protein